MPAGDLLGDDVEADAAELAVVPVKYSSTRSWARPTASNTWAPVYDATVEMPILDIIFSTPLVQALMKLRSALGLLMPAMTPSSMRSWMVSNARYGLMAAAPYPMSSAMWCTSRASPHSTTRPTWVRVFSRIRWWCTAEASSSEGIGASSPLEWRSERMMTLAPSAMASDTLADTSSMARRMPSPPSATGYRPSMAKGLNPGMSPSSLM